MTDCVAWRHDSSCDVRVALRACAMHATVTQQMSGMKFTPSARNPPVPPTQAQVPPSQQDVGTENHSSQQFLKSLTQSSPQLQKQIIGEHLYREIYAMHSDLAGKITGMLLEMDNSELLHMLEVPESLKSKVEEAINVLRDHQRSGSWANCSPSKSN